MSDRDLRSRYETAVLGLCTLVATMQRDDASSEAIARAVHLERRRLAAMFKELTPEPLSSRIYDRTLAVYGDRLGPSVEWLRARGKTWDDIIDSATNPGPRFSLDVCSVEGDRVRLLQPEPM